MHLVRDQRARQSEAIYRQYLQYSKNASHLFTLLIITAVFITITLIINWNSLSIERDKVKNEVSTIYGPTDINQYHKALQALLVLKAYRLPITNQEISGNVFYSFSPIIIFAISIGFWLNLKFSFNSINRLKLEYGSFSNNSLFPWIFNIPLRNARLKAFWQVLIEIFPIFLLIGLLLMYLSQIDFLFIPLIILTIIIFVPTLLHIFLFDVPFHSDEGQFFIINLLAVVCGIIVYVVFSYRGEKLFLGSWGYLYAGSLLLTLFEMLLSGRSLFFYIIFMPLFIPTYVMLAIVSDLLRHGPRHYKVWKSILPFYFNRWLDIIRYIPNQPINGYLGYIKKRCDFINTISDN
jgi:hypothetical protein